MVQQKQSKKSDESKKAIQLLIARAASDSKFALELAKDLDGIIKKNKLPIDGESEEYKELALKVFHTNLLLQKAFEELQQKFGKPGKLAAPAPGAGAAYIDMVRPEDLITTPIDIKALKVEIMKDLKEEILKELKQS